MTIPESPTPDPTPPAPERSFGLIAVAALVVSGFVGGVLVAALMARQTQHDITQLRASVTTLQQDFERSRESTKALAASTDRHVVLPFADSGFQPIRTNGGTLLIALGEVKPLQNTVIVQLRVGNPQSVTYRGLCSHARVGQAAVGAEVRTCDARTRPVGDRAGDVDAGGSGNDEVAPYHRRIRQSDSRALTFRLGSQLALFPLDREQLARRERIEFSA